MPLATLVVAATEPELCRHAGLVCGVGPVEAAATTARALANGAVDAVLHIGIAGARRSSGVRVAELVVGERAVYEDLSVRQLAPAEVLPDAALLAAVRDALPAARLLPIGTTAHVAATRACPVEAMEGFAVLRAAQLAGVPGVEVRAISNLIEDERAEWRIDDALEALGQALPKLQASIAAAVATRR